MSTPFYKKWEREIKAMRKRDFTVRKSLTMMRKKFCLWKWTKKETRKAIVKDIQKY
jgi:hypothetical protein